MYDSSSEGVISWRAIRRDPLRIVRMAADMVMVARDTASMSPPSLNGSRTSLLRNCAGNSARSIEKSPYGSRWSPTTTPVRMPFMSMPTRIGIGPP